VFLVEVVFAGIVLSLIRVRSIGVATLLEKRLGVSPWILASVRGKPSPDAIIEEQLSHTPDEQATRIKRRLQEHREQGEKKV
jgi:hypothetical protein